MLVFLQNEVDNNYLVMYLTTCSERGDAVESAGPAPGYYVALSFVCTRDQLMVELRREDEAAFIN